VDDNSKLILIEDTVLTMRNRYTGDRSRKFTRGMSGHVRANDAMVKYKCLLVRLRIEIQSLLHPYSFIARDTRSSSI
jgi:hypothetical protein